VKIVKIIYQAGCKRIGGSMTPTEQDKELDLFSQEALKIAEALRNKYPNTWELLYNNHVMPEIIAFITADRKRVALEAKIELIDNMLNSSPAILHDCGRRLGGVFGKTYLEHKKSELKAQQEEV